MDKLLKKTRRFLEKITREYYIRTTPYLPSDYMLREFALQTWHGKSYIRHLAFQDINEVKKLLIDKAPRHFYYSSARYNQPEASEMESKGWRSSDLIFDIDADHLRECGDKVVEIRVEYTGEKIGLVDDECIVRAALRALMLKDILVYELGVDDKRVSIEFSGNRGFHVTAYLDDNDELARANSDIRREIVNYVKAVDLLDDILEPWRKLSLRRGKPAPIPPSLLGSGARGRLARIMLRLAQQRGMSSVVSRLRSNRFVSAYDEDLRMLEAEAREFIGIEIDEQVTVDVSRLIRAPLSLNGKTMLPVIPLREQQLLEFKMSPSLSPFIREEPIRIRMLADIPSTIRIIGTKLKLRQGDRPKLEAPLALYMLSRGLAVLDA